MRQAEIARAADSRIDHWFPPASSPERGLIVRVTTTQGSTWVGSFALEYEAPEAVSTLVSWADATILLVVAAGRGYMAEIDEPGSYATVQTFPILHCLHLGDDVLLASYTSLALVSPHGVQWETPRVSWDGLRNLKAAGGAVSGQAWDAPSNAWVPLTVDLATGAVTGGSSPPTH
jgi:hypothetical protein